MEATADNRESDAGGGAAFYPSAVYRPSGGKKSGVARGLTPIYLSALGLIAFLSFASYYILHQILSEQVKSAAVINVSGGQAQLAQRIDYFALELVAVDDSHKRDIIRRVLLETAKKMETAHVGLISGDPQLNLPVNPSDELKAIYFKAPYQLDQQVRDYVTQARQMAAEPDAKLGFQNTHLRYLLGRGPGFLQKSLGAATHQYQVESDAAVKRIQNLETGALGLTLFTLAMEALFIFRPMVNRIRKSTGEIEEAREFSENVVSTAQALMVGMDRNGRITLFNQQAESVTGWGHDDAMDKSFIESFIPEEWKENWSDIFRRMLAGEGASSIESPLLTRRGNQRIVTWNNTLVRDSKGAPSMVLGTGIDVTARREAEEALKLALDEQERSGERLRKEIALAAQLQRVLLPPSDFSLPGLRGEAELLTSSEVGGDYYDYYEVGGHRTVVLVGDVSGHGVASGTMVSAAKAGVNLLSTEGVADPGEILRRLNETILATARQSMLMTMACVSIDTRTGEIFFANAGHQFPYLRIAGEWIHLEAGGLPLGKLQKTSWPVEAFGWEVGDRLFMFTDGVVESESPDGEPFGYDRLEDLLRKYGSEPAEVLRARILEALQEHCRSSGFADDVTLLSVDYTEQIMGRATARFGVKDEEQELVRIAETFYRTRSNPFSPRIARQSMVFLAEGPYFDLLPRLSQDGIRRVLPRHQKLISRLGWDALLSQHQVQVGDDIHRLIPDSEVHRQFELTHSDDKVFVMQEVEAWLAEVGGVSPEHLDAVVLLLDEMMENALYAAPRDWNDKPIYAKGAQRPLTEKEMIRVDVVLGRETLGIMMTDNWGTLTPAVFLKRMSLHRMGMGIEAGVGGSGLYLMWRMSGYLQMRVHPKRQTQVTAVLDLAASVDPETDKGFQFLYHSEMDEVARNDEQQHTLY